MVTGDSRRRHGFPPLALGVIQRCSRAEVVRVPIAGLLRGPDALNLGRECIAAIKVGRIDTVTPDREPARSGAARGPAQGTDFGYNGVMVLHPMEDFWARLSAFNDYPPDVTPVPELLPGTAAFAASAGLYREHGSRELPPFPYGGLMVVGHNVDSRPNYEARRISGSSHGDLVPGPPMSTWRGLYKILDQAGVPRQQFFFTNVFAGLKEGTATGRFSVHPSSDFRRWCTDFLRYQITIMRPCVIMVLGVPACGEIAGVTTPYPWPRGVLPPPQALRARVAGHDTTLVPVSHPSYQKRVAPDAAVLRDAWSHPRD